MPVLLDSGIRGGADAFKALALGATAVLLGRPYVYGLAIAGEAGVREVLQNFKADFDLTMGLAGCRSVAEIGPRGASRALSVSAVYGGAGLARQAKLASRAHIVVATPGRLEDLIARRSITLEHVKILVLDEADRMLDMGFRPPVDRIVSRVPKKRQTLFFSATLRRRGTPPGAHLPRRTRARTSTSPRAS